MNNEPCCESQIEKAKAVPCRIGDQVKLVGALHDHINSLTKQLNPLIRLEPAGPADGCKSECPTPTLLSDKLNINNSGIEAAIGKLKGLMNRLEI